MAGITSTKKIKGQPHFLAYITPSEAKTLENLGGQKTMTKEGVPAYPPGEKYGGKDSSGNFNDPTPSSPPSSTTTNQSNNEGNQSIQDYYDDQSNLTGQTVITDEDRDAFFQTPVGKTFKDAADQAAAKKKEQQEKARKEKERIDKILDEYRDTEPKAYKYGTPIKNYKKKYFIGPQKYSTSTKIRQLAIKNLIDKKLGLKSTMPNIFEMNNFFNPSMVDSEYTYNTGPTTDMMGVNLQNYTDMDEYGLTGENLTDVDRMNQALDTSEETGTLSQTEFENAFYGPDGKPNFGGGGGGRDNSTILPYPYNVQQPDEGEEEDTGPDYRFGTGQKEGLDVTLGRYFNQGGRVPRNMGGIMNAVPRQGYFLGKIVKGVGKAIGSVADAAGKVLSSDLGKAALAGAAFYYGGGGTFKPGGSSTFKLGNFFSSKNPLLFSAGTGKNLGNQVFNPMKFAGLTTLGGFLAGPAKVDQMPGDDGARGGRLLDSQGNEVLPAGIRAEIDEAYESKDPERIKAIENYYAFLSPTEQYLPYPNYAVGGRVAAQEGGLMNLGGMEKDYRAEGGFVPIGKQEKADDVPARLSVNEFVFTADAVRNAGGGDIDKGAEVMENMMKNLENGGTVSEESQGNTGAQEMFSVSERIGEVI